MDILKHISFLFFSCLSSFSFSPQSCSTTSCLFSPSCITECCSCASKIDWINSLFIPLPLSSFFSIHLGVAFSKHIKLIGDRLRTSIPKETKQDNVFFSCFQNSNTLTFVSLWCMQAETEILGDRCGMTERRLRWNSKKSVNTSTQRKLCSLNLIIWSCSVLYV